eukprot:gene632-2487_t
MSGVILTEMHGKVGVVTLNRPDRMNGWTNDLATGLFDALADLGANPQCRAIVVTGAGRAFCAGADLGGLSKAANDGQRRLKEGQGATDTRCNTLTSSRPHRWVPTPGAARRAPAPTQPRPSQGVVGGCHAAAPARPTIRSVMFATTIKKPVIAAINGPAAGIGLAFALACDVRFALPSAKFTLAFSKRGLVCEHGTSWTLPKLVGTGNALAFAFSSEVITGTEAARMGMVERLSDTPLQAALAFAQ